MGVKPTDTLQKVVDAICRQEQLSSDLTVELYAAEGYPLAPSPSLLKGKQPVFNFMPWLLT